VDLPQLADTIIARPFSSPLPASRPRTHEDKPEHDALQTAAHAECLAAVKRTGVKPTKKSERVSSTPSRKSNAERDALSKQRQEEHAAAAKACRLKNLEILSGYLKNTRTLPELILFPAHEDASADGAAAAHPATSLSEAQTQRALNQARALHTFYAIVEAHYPNKNVLECADLAAECTGVAAGSTVHDWHLEVHSPNPLAHTLPKQLNKSNLFLLQYSLCETTASYSRTAAGTGSDRA
jgi:hypothetical protein